LAGISAKGVKLKSQRRERIADLVSKHGGGQAALGKLALLFQFSPLSFALGRAPEAIGHDANATDNQKCDEGLPADFLDQRPFHAPEIMPQLRNRQIEINNPARLAVLFPHE